MKTISVSVLACCLATCNLLVADTIELPNLVANTEKEGFILLSQGYRGRFTKSFNDPEKLAEQQIDFEFTHGVLDRGRQEDGTSAPQRIAVRLSTPADSEIRFYRSFATFREKIPDFKTLCDTDRLQDFERLLGKNKGHIPAWKYDGNMAYHTMSWTLFTVLTNQAIRVVEVSINIGKSTTVSKILETRIQEGTFHATGKPPIFEDQNRKEGEHADTEQPATSS